MHLLPSTAVFVAVCSVPFAIPLQIPRLTQLPRRWLICCICTCLNPTGRDAARMLLLRPAVIETCRLTITKVGWVHMHAVPLCSLIGAQVTRRQLHSQAAKEKIRYSWCVARACFVVATKLLTVLFNIAMYYV